MDFTIVVLKKNCFIFVLGIILSGQVVLDPRHEFLETADGVDHILAKTPHLNLVLDRKVIDVVAPRLRCDPDKVVSLTTNQ